MLLRTLVRRVTLTVCMLGAATSNASVSEVIFIGDNAFLVIAQAKDRWSTRGAQKTKAFEKAHDFCVAQGREMQSIGGKVSERGQTAYAEVEFRCVAPVR